ncbi:MAG: trypsin-like peptidase domain-containing protein [Phycisphaerae bacterium]|nr:trypsin-like peptidase domain-containing protein [Phycisphaerae bacterium]
MQQLLSRLLAIFVVLHTGVIVGLAAPVHDDPNQAVEIRLDEVYSGTSREATGEALSHCGIRDSRDVWHRFTAPRDGLFKVEVISSTFDSILSVFDPCSMAELACSDMTCFGQPQIMMPVASGTQWLIRVAGYAQTSGNYTLLVSQVSDTALLTSLDPYPADQARDISPATMLCWDGTEPALGQSPIVSLQIAAPSMMTPMTIYGEDNRVDEYDVEDANRLAVGQAVAMLMVPENILDNGDGTVTLFSGSLGEEYAVLTGRLLCPEERFRDQPAPGSATGFLVAPQILATAGHVVSCANDYGLDKVVVFDFVMADANTPAVIVDPDNIYTMEKVLAFNDGMPDWALVQLDRAVTGRSPLPLRRQGQLADDVNDLLVIGHPLGLPRKYSDHGQVLDNRDPSYFETDLDVNGGSSGSPVVHPDTLEVEGILFASYNDDFIPGEAYEGRCDCALICPDEAGLCDGWEWVTRATHFSHLIPVFDVSMGLAPDALTQVASQLNVSCFTPRDLEPSTTYFWQVQAHTVEGSSLSPVWSFTTNNRKGLPRKTSLVESL